MVSSDLLDSDLGGSGIQMGLAVSRVNFEPLASGLDPAVAALAPGWPEPGWPEPGPLGWLPFMVPRWMDGPTCSRVRRFADR